VLYTLQVEKSIVNSVEVVNRLWENVCSWCSCWGVWMEKRRATTAGRGHINQHNAMHSTQLASIIFTPPRDSSWAWADPVLHDGGGADPLHPLNVPSSILSTFLPSVLHYLHPIPSIPTPSSSPSTPLFPSLPPYLSNAAKEWKKRGERVLWQVLYILPFIFRQLTSSSMGLTHWNSGSSAHWGHSTLAPSAHEFEWWLGKRSHFGWVTCCPWFSDSKHSKRERFWHLHHKAFHRLDSPKHPRKPEAF